MEPQVVYHFLKGDGISALLNACFEALSAIQKQTFMELRLDDPDYYYSEAFTLKHRLILFLTFLKVGLFEELGTCLLTLIGVVLHVLGTMNAVPVFGYEITAFSHVLFFIIVTLEFLMWLEATLDATEKKIEKVKKLIEE